MPVEQQVINVWTRAARVTEMVYFILLFNTFNNSKGKYGFPAAAVQLQCSVKSSMKRIETREGCLTKQVSRELTKQQHMSNSSRDYHPVLPAAAVADSSW